MRILVVGAGIAGLGAALALSGEGRRVEVIDRDPPPPPGGMNDIFEHWDRKGATQLRHSHAFQARMVRMIRTLYPELYKRLVNAGVREVGFDAVLWPSLRTEYRPAPIDEEWKVLTSRRTTLEAVMRAYAEECSGAVFRSGYKVRSIVCAPSAAGIPIATALKVETPDGAEDMWEADLIVDAAGRNSPFVDWLKEYGVEPEFEESPAGILYFTRHYRLNPGRDEPDRSQASGGDFGFIRGNAYPGDGGNFTITIFVPEFETDLRRVVLHPDVFDAFASRMPGVRRWLEPGRAFATSKVFGMGNLRSIWRHWIKNDRPLLLNFFAIGDSTMRSNPFYGRGCAIATVHAHVLAEVLRKTDDAAERAKLFDKMIQQEIRPFYDMMVRQDEAAMKRAAAAQNPNAKTSFVAKVMTSFAEDGVVPAMRSNIKVTRAFYRSANMLEGPDWLRKPEMLAIVLATWATPKRFKRHLYQQMEGLNRSELLAIAHEKIRSQATF